MKMTKKDIIDNLYSEMDLVREKCESAFESTLEIIKNELELGNKVSISGFGKWVVREKGSRNGRNPQTGEALIISGRRVVTFKCSPNLRKALE